jgi:myxalamid-type polyketide synthase MxaE and MxaD
MTSITEALSQMTPLQRAVLALKQAQSQLEHLKRSRSEPIAIIGLGCRFPGEAGTPAAFWRLLEAGTDAIGEVPPDRWDIDAYYDPDPDAPGKMSTRYGGFLGRVDGFDPEFFGIAPRETVSMDPQQRLLLEVAWEALERAGLPPDRLAGSQTGVFIGISSDDYRDLQNGQGAAIDAYTGTGTAYSIAAGRLSYLLGLHGPCFPVDTACSSSLVAVHLACQSLRADECDLALAGGVNLILSPERMVYFSKLRAMAPDGRCKTFDARADGYVRGEGCGVLLLKRLSDAQRDGDPIWAVVRGSAVNQDGRSNGLTAPNGQAQQAVIRAALAQAGIAPETVGYVEAHGTGTQLGDPIEIAALARVLGAGRAAGQPLWVGSVKTNLGHLEAAAGMAGLIKTILALQQQTIPPHLHFATPNPLIAWAELPVSVPTQSQPWPAPDGPRRAGVSAFGLSGTNAHVVLEEAPAIAADDAPPREPAPCLLPLSARTPEALRALAQRYAALLAEPDAPPLAELAAAAGAGRSHFAERAAIVAGASVEAQAALNALAEGRPHPALQVGQVPPAAPRPRIVFVCAGQGGQWAGMLAALRPDPVAAAKLEQVAQAAPPDLGWSLAELLADPAAPWLERIDQLQPVLFAVQLALAARLRAWGVEPAAVVGHSFGEVAAAHLAGALSLADALRVICARSRALAQRRGQGTMALVELPVAEAEAALAGQNGAVSIAGVNGPRSVVLSGDQAALAALVTSLSAQGVFARRLAVDVAAHSPQLDELLPMLTSELAGIEPQTGELPFYSTVTGRLADGAALDGAYWAQNLRAPVRFWEAVQALAADGHTLFVELGPHPTLVAALADGLRALGLIGQATASLRRDRPAQETLLAAVGALYCAGAPITWPAEPAQRRAVAALPTYPFQNERYWLESGGRAVAHPAAQAQPGWPGAEVRSPMLAGALFQTSLSAAAFPWLNDHRIDGRIVVAGAAHLSLALSAAAAANQRDACMLADIRFTQALILDPDEARPVQAGLAPAADGASSFQVYSLASSAGGDWTLHAAGSLLSAAPDRAEASASVALEAIRARCLTDLSSDDLYQQLWAAGYQLGPSFRWAERIWRGEGEALCRLRAPRPTEAQPYLLHPGLLDTCFQMTAASLPVESLRRMADGWTVTAPVALDRLRFHRRAAGAAWCHVVARASSNVNAAEVIADIRLLDESGELIAVLEGFRARRIARSDLLGAALPADEWLYQLTWRAQPLESLAAPAPAGQPGAWLILADRGGVGQALARQTEARGESCVALAHAELNRLSRDLNLSPGDALRRLLAESFGASQPRCRGIVHLWSLDAPAELTSDALAAAHDLGSVSALHLVQALAQIGWRDLPRLWLVTRGAQAVEPGQLAPGAAQAPLWGLGRTIALEHPELACSRVDLEAGGAPGEAQALLQEIVAAGPEDQVALRGAGRYVARLVRAALPAPAGPVTCDPQASYLIVGGLGGVGLVAARWLVEQGARHLALLGRTPPSAAAEAALAELRAAGAEVVVLQADAARAPELAAALDQLKAAQPPLRGVIHAAAVLDDGLLIGLTPDRLRMPLTPKADVALNLHALTAGSQLDFFVLFSSLAGLLGAPGQANYAAANAFLDALAHHRRALGLPALSINWGPWAEVGQAAAQANRGQRLAQRGLASIPPRLGVAALGRLLGAGLSQAAVMSFNLRQWREFYPAAAALPLLAELAAAQPAADAARPAGLLRAALEAGPPGQRRSLLEAHLREQIAQVMRLDPAQLAASTPLGSLGLDSLMGLEIRNRLEASLGLTISAALLWTYPTIAALAEHFAQALDLPPEAPPVPAPASSAPSIPDELRRTAEEIAGLSEAEMEALLLKKLAGRGKAVES